MTTDVQDDSDDDARSAVRASLAQFACESAGLRDVGPDVAAAACRAWWQARMAGLELQQLERPA